MHMISQIIGRSISSGGICTVVASMGRSGSTVSYGSFLRSMKWRFGLRAAKAASGFYQDLATAPLHPGSVVKTHDYPEGLADRSGDIRVLFCFGSPIDAVLSVKRQTETKGTAWGKQHLSNLRSQGSIDEILDRDVLGLEAQVDSWSRYEGHPTLCVHYDALWTAQDQISDFFEHNFRMPEKKIAQHNANCGPLRS